LETIGGNASREEEEDFHPLVDGMTEIITSRFQKLSMVFPDESTFWGKESGAAL